MLERKALSHSANGSALLILPPSFAAHLILPPLMGVNPETVSPLLIGMFFTNSNTYSLMMSQSWTCQTILCICLSSMRPMILQLLPSAMTRISARLRAPSPFELQKASLWTSSLVNGDYNPPWSYFFSIFLILFWVFHSFSQHSVAYFGPRSLVVLPLV